MNSVVNRSRLNRAKELLKPLLMYEDLVNTIDRLLTVIEMVKRFDCTIEVTWAKNRDYYYHYAKCRDPALPSSVYLKPEDVGVWSRLIEMASSYDFDVLKHFLEDLKSVLEDIQALLRESSEESESKEEFKGRSHG